MLGAPTIVRPARARISALWVPGVAIMHGLLRENIDDPLLKPEAVEDRQTSATRTARFQAVCAERLPRGTNGHRLRVL